VAQTVASVKAAGGSTAAGKKTLTTLSRLIDDFQAGTDALSKALEHAGKTAEAHARYCRDKVVPLMTALREAGDAIEVMAPSDVWPLPTYREMLFIK
jgi:glutamine synthetase